MFSVESFSSLYHDFMDGDFYVFGFQCCGLQQETTADAQISRAHLRSKSLSCRPRSVAASQSAELSALQKHSLSTGCVCAFCDVCVSEFITIQKEKTLSWFLVNLMKPILLFRVVVSFFLFFSGSPSFCDILSLFRLCFFKYYFWLTFCLSEKSFVVLAFSVYTKVL